MWQREIRRSLSRSRAPPKKRMPDRRFEATICQIFFPKIIKLNKVEVEF